MQPCQYLRPLSLYFLCSLALACSDDPKQPREVPTDDGGDSEADASVEQDAEVEPPDAAEPEPAVFGGLTVDTSPAEQAIDLFGKVGHRFWFEVTREQVSIMNEGRRNPGPWLAAKAARRPIAPAYRLAGEPDVGIPIDPWPGGPGNGGDIYTPPGDPKEDATFADHVVVQDVVTKSVADYGKLELALVGESTSREWTKRQIPNFRIDTDEFQPKVRIGGFEHFRLNNALVGTIFREHLAHRVFRALGYPALRSSFAFVGSNYWGENVWIPMVLMEAYKRKFCKDNQELLGGTCRNMWEFAGDAGRDALQSNACQVGSCDNTRMEDLIEAIANTPAGPGFKVALSEIVDWQRHHEFQCIGWILATGDDALRNNNNNLIIERETDHRLVWAPYSVDISAGQEWYVDAQLLGQSSLALGCQADPDCWEDVYVTCEDLVEKFEKLRAESFVDETVAVLTEHGMMRDGDDSRAEALHAWYAGRAAYVKNVLPNYRYLPDTDGVCPHDLFACQDGGCGTQEECLERRCVPGEYWCESIGYCKRVDDLDCPVCENELPKFCGVSQECVADVAACSEICKEIMGPEYIYCEAVQGCEQARWCFDDGQPEPLPPF